jgi:heterodisulfide reductase subunit A-like polyferredoxin
MLAASGYVCQTAPDRCIGCGTCAEYCQFGAISINGNATVDRAACMGCGVCVDKCEQGALMLARDESKGTPLELDVLMRAAMAG